MKGTVLPDLGTLREQLQSKHGKSYWRSLEELADTPAFRDFVEREFPSGSSWFQSPIDRRTFLKLAGASLALAGMVACTPQPEEKIVPYVNQPEEITPGEPLFYATAFTLSGFANGILAESHMGRPTKIEGNPDHPGSLGATDAFAQASILTLYDPDRSQTIKNDGRIRTRESFTAALQTALSSADAGGVRLLTPYITSPTLLEQISTFLDQYPESQWHQFEPMNRDNIYAGTEMSFGERFDPVYQFADADVVLSLEHDFLLTDPGHVRYTHDFMDRRRVRDKAVDMNRLYVVEGTPSLTGSKADHRWRLQSTRVEMFVRAVAHYVGMEVDIPAEISDIWNHRAEVVAADLTDHAGRSLVSAGISQPPIVHALAHQLNQTLGNIGSTVSYIEPIIHRTVSLQELVQDIQAGEVDVLLIMGGNPAYAAPADLHFANALSQVNYSAYLGLYENETSRLCQWHIPEAHYLESWSDARAYDGTASIIQPLIAPLYNGWTPHELLAVTLNSGTHDPLDIVKQHWQSDIGGDDFENAWRRILHDGIIPESAYPAQSVSLDGEALPEYSPPLESLEVIFRPDPSIWDGQFNNNGWMQELPKPFTKLTWDNAALLSPATAERLGLSNEDVIRLKLDNYEVEAPVWILPGQADECVTVSLGYGRSATGHIGQDVGYNAYDLRTSSDLWHAIGVEIEPTGEHHHLVTTQTHFNMEGRDLIRESTVQKFEDNPLWSEGGEELPSLYPGYDEEGYQWGMSIDLTACIGCNACMVACQAENNIPIVGKSQVDMGREMHWIRVDGYYGGDMDDPDLLHQPVTCMHCENAPCEPVCPVGATVHSEEGLNQMVYNRCVGTRYCSNNCPYKVRRFNFLEYSDPDLRILNNPEVTVRSRGVMEKCTYCVQRINHSRIQAEKEGRTIADGELQTACQAACPAQAIVFGDISDPDTQISKLKSQPHDYGLLTELNTRPRTTYLAHITNPNPMLAEDDS